MRARRSHIASDECPGLVLGRLTLETAARPPVMNVTPHDSNCMNRRTAAAVVIAIIIGAADVSPAAADDPVSFELITAPGFPITGMMKWLDLFKRLDQTNIQIRGSRGSEKAEVANRGSETRPRYHVVGLLSDRNRLVLPGGEFGIDDQSGLQKWIDKLQREGVEGLTAQRGAFGLTREQMQLVDQRMRKQVEFNTKDVRTGDVVRKIVQGLQVEFQVTPAARTAFARNETTLDELQGLSSGTALAAALRPLGLVTAPRNASRGQVELVICDVRELDEPWPIGWPPGDSPFKVAPTLFEYLTVEIRETPLSEALAAIQPRVEVPFLFDHNALARHGIDPTDVNVSFPRGRVLYRKLIDKVLFDARLQGELRIDESGRPLLWISTIKR